MVRESFARGEDHEAPAIEYRILLDDGSERVLEGRGSYRFENGRPVMGVGTVQDVEELRGAAHALREA